MTVRNIAHAPIPASSLRRAALSGFVWLMASSISNRAAVFLSQLVLAKLLDPKDFGIFGLAGTIVTIFSVLAEIGVEQVLQQRRARMRLWTTQAFWVSLVLSIMVALAMSAAAPVGAAIYGSPQIATVVWISAASLPPAALATVPRAQLQATMRFGLLSSFATAELIATQIATICLAWAGFGVTSFVLPLPALAIIRAIWAWRVAPVPIRSIRHCRRWRIMASRGSMILGSRIVNIFVEQGDYITLGLLASTHVVGLYYFAYRIAAQPMRMLAGNLNAVLFPALNAIPGEPAKRRDTALQASELLGALTVPVCFLQASIAEPVFRLFFSSNWDGAIPILQILSLGLPFDAIAWPAGSLLAVRGKFRTTFLYQLAFTPLFFGLVVSGALLDSGIGVAVGVGLYCLIHPTAFSLLVFVREGIPVARVLKSYLIPMALGIGTIGASHVIGLAMYGTGPSLAHIAQNLILGGGAYALAVRVTAPRLYQSAAGLLVGKLRGGRLWRARVLTGVGT